MPGAREVRHLPSSALRAIADAFRQHADAFDSIAEAVDELELGTIPVAHMKSLERAFGFILKAQTSARASTQKPFTLAGHVIKTEDPGRIAEKIEAAAVHDREPPPPAKKKPARRVK